MLAVVIVSLAARLVYLFEYMDHQLFSYLFLDPLWHHQWAKSIAAGDAFDKVFFRAPLYPWLLGLLYWLSGASTVAARAIQFLLGTMSAALVYLLGRRLLTSGPAAFICGLCFALYGPMIFFEGELLMPALIVFLDLSGLVLLFAAVERRGPCLFAACGLVLGLSAIARPNVLLPAAGIGVWLFLSGNKETYWKRFCVRALPFIAALMVPPLAVTARNCLSGDCVFIASQGGVNFYIGNNPSADGKTAVAPGMQTGAGESYVDSVWLSSVSEAERMAGKELGPAEVSAFWYREALAWIAHEPGAAAALYLKKLYYLVNGFETPSNNVPYFARTYSTAMAALVREARVAFPAGLLIPLGIAGMVMAWPSRKTWAPLYLFTLLYASTIVMFFVTSRYRMPLVGPLILFAVCGLRSAAASVSGKGWKRAGAYALILVALLIVSNSRALGVRQVDRTAPLSNLGNYYLEKGELEKAAGYYGRVLEAQPGDYMALANLGAIAFHQGEFRAAERLYRRSLEINPVQPALHLNLGLLLERRGELEAARRRYDSALQLYPSYERAEEGLKRVDGMLEKAEGRGAR